MNEWLKLMLGEANFANLGSASALFYYHCMDIVHRYGFLSWQSMEINAQKRAITEEFNRNFGVNTGILMLSDQDRINAENFRPTEEQPLVTVENTRRSPESYRTAVMPPSDITSNMSPSYILGMPGFDSYFTVREEKEPTPKKKVEKKVTDELYKFLTTMKKPIIQELVLTEPEYCELADRMGFNTLNQFEYKTVIIKNKDCA